MIWWLAGRVDEPELTTGGAPAGPSLLAGDRQLLPPRPGTLADAQGLAVEGEDLVVVAARRRGFFAGASRTSRVYVAWDGAIPEPGAPVDLTGVVRRPPRDARRRLGLGPRDAAVLRRQGGYVAADDVLHGDASGP